MAHRGGGGRLFDRKVKHESPRCTLSIGGFSFCDLNQGRLVVFSTGSPVADCPDWVAGSLGLGGVVGMVTIKGSFGEFLSDIKAGGGWSQPIITAYN